MFCIYYIFDNPTLLQPWQLNNTKPVFYFPFHWNEDHMSLLPTSPFNAKLLLATQTGTLTERNFFFFTLDHRSGDTGRGVCWRKGWPDKGRGVCWHWPGVHGSPGSKGCSAAAHSHGPWVSLFPTSSNARAIAFNKRVSNAQNLSEVPWEIVPLLCIPLEWSECPGCCCTGLQ